MKKSYRNAGLTRLRTLGLTALLAGAAATAQAQFRFLAPNTLTVAGTYTDLGTSGTAIATANTDDANSAPVALPAGFAFTYNGVLQTQFVLNTNGFIKFGATAPAAPFFSAYAQEAANGGPVSRTTESNLIFPFNCDLEAGNGAGGTGYRMAVTGAAPSRVVTIQWKNVSDKARVGLSTQPGNVEKQFANISFQVKLYETSGNIDFVYSAATPSTLPDVANFVLVGIKGTGTTATDAVTAVKPSNTAWAQTLFQAGVYTTGNAHNIRNRASVAGGTPLPDDGRTYRFVIPVAADAATQLVYGYDKLAVPAGSPAEIRALVRNAGTAALGSFSVTLNITGANTVTGVPQTVPSLAAGASAVVTFPPVAVPNLGNNTVTVRTALAADGNATNDSRSMTMVTNATTFSYDTPGQGSAGSVFGGAVDNYYAAKFRLNAPRDVVAVRAYISEAQTSATVKTSVGETVYGVVVDAASGALLGRSADYVITAADISIPHTFTLSAPITVPAGDVLVGMARGATSSTLNFYPYYVQSEDPTRPNTFYAGSVTTPAAPALLFAGANSRFKLPYEMVTAAPATCPTAGNIAVANVTTTSASVSFTGPTNGTAYQVVYVPTGTTPTATSPFVAGTASPINLTGLTNNTGYDVYVRVLCGATDQSQLAGPVFFSTPCVSAIVQTFPYVQNFDNIARGQDLPCGITVLNSNADGAAWEPVNSITVGPTTSTVFRSGPFAMTYAADPAGAPQDADDWFFLPAMRLVSGQAYRLSFWYRGQRTALREALEVKYGNAATPAGQANLLYSNLAINSPTYAQATNSSTPALADIRPTTTGVYYVGFHAISPADQLFLSVDDVTVTNLVSSSAALTRAVSVYPNPSNTGSFNLDIRGANAQGALQVEVTNMLGQRVYSASAKDNFTTQLNLSNLANGIYTLKVRNGGEYMQQQVSIVK